MTISRKWLLALFQTESMRDSFWSEYLEYILMGLHHGEAQCAAENYEIAERACLYAARKIMCE